MRRRKSHSLAGTKLICLNPVLLWLSLSLYPGDAATTGRCGSAMPEGSHRYHNTAAACLAPLFEPKLYFSLLGKGGNFNQLLLQLCSAPQELGWRGACAIRGNRRDAAGANGCPRESMGQCSKAPPSPRAGASLMLQ